MVFYIHGYNFRENNCRHAMKMARQQFGIPLILRPEYLSSVELDEMSAITYLSYFMKVGAPGYNSTLQRIQPLVRNTPVYNFTVSFYCSLEIFIRVQNQIFKKETNMSRKL